jgi:uncharacterized protein YijF (DUF1287 family)
MHPSNLPRTNCYWIDRCIMKHLAWILISIFSAIAVLALTLGYHGQRIFNKGERLPAAQTVVKNARSLIGVPYDPLMGTHNNIGATAGFIVCSDVPNIAFGLEGYSWKKVLEKDFLVHSSAYDTSNGNNPNNPYFPRRARNLYAYFKANNKLRTGSHQPSPGDLVFYRKTENGYIAHVALVTEVGKNGYKIMESAPKTIFAQEVDGQSPIERGWIFTGFGKVY